MMSAAIRQMAKVAPPSPTASAEVLSGEDLGAMSVHKSSLQRQG